MRIIKTEFLNPHAINIAHAKKNDDTILNLRFCI